MLVTAGATEAIVATVLALCEPGDEVICFEPFYDSYAACIALAGAVRHLVTLYAEDFAGDITGAIEAVQPGPRARLLLLNSPHNPTGKVFSRRELEAIAKLCREHDLIAVTDEVYEHLVFDGVRHVPLATFPGMRERTVTISSAGKTFSCTGWKVGWLCAASPLQPAVATALRLPRTYFTDLATTLAAKRDRLCAGLEAAGFIVHPPAGTCYVTADISPFGAEDGVTFCRRLPERCGVVAVPVGAFYDDQDAGRTLIRFAFCRIPCWRKLSAGWPGWASTAATVVSGGLNSSWRLVEAGGYGCGSGSSASPPGGVGGSPTTSRRPHPGSWSG